MQISKRALMSTTLAAGVLGAVRGPRAQAKPRIRIGVLNDQSSAYRDNGGVGTVACARLAAAEISAETGIEVEIRSADHENKVDKAMLLARQWFDEGVDALLDIQNSAIALGVANLARERDKVVLGTNVGTAEVTGKACTPNFVHFAYDSAMLANVSGTAVVRQGGKRWFFIRPDYAFGRAMQDDATTAITRAGGQVIGSIALPFPSTDFAAAVLQAQQSGADVIGFCNSGDELVSALKQAQEFGVGKNGQRLVALLVLINSVHSMGLQTAQGLTLTANFYWDMNDGTREFSRRALEAGFNRAMRPNMGQAAAYSAVRHYIKAVKSVGVETAQKSGAAAVARMKDLPIEDLVYGKASIRADGRTITPAYLFQIKSPAQSKYEWDYYTLLQTVPGDQAWRPLSEGGCPLIKA